MAPCLNCVTEEKCTECVEGFVLDGDGCLGCPADCSVCTHTDSCDTCKSGFFVNLMGWCTACIEGC